MPRKGEQEDCKSQKTKEFAVRLCLLVQSEARHIKSHQCDCPNVEQNQDDINGHAKADNGKFLKPQSYIKMTGN